ncbi:hypothetical protein LJC18_01195 [Lachnospiraceae bacterium OttesenSCG-928-E19]|nr:hypothetical protein [Lachnospiraceae bacterium OttesenSCG-928-E19]
MSRFDIRTFIRIISFVSVVGAMGNAYAWPLLTSSSIKNAWGVSSTDWNQYPRGSTHANFCVGNTISGSGGCQTKLGIHGDDQAMVGLVAWKITENGGYFCVTQFQCEGKSSSWTWNLAPNGTQKCFWLCKDGYGGDGCLAVNKSEYTLNTGNSACASTTIARADFSSNTVRTSGSTSLNQEHSIDLLHNGYDAGREQDVMIGVSGWLENKKGVQASPFLFQCTNRADSNTMDVNFYTAKKTMNLCLPGYTGANCEKCKPAKMANGYSLSQFNASIHTMTEKNGYSEFRCTDTAKGFKSENEKNQCVTCTTLGGVDASGKCITCKTGTIYTKNTNTSGGYCKTATKYSQSDMRYGKGKDSSIDVNKQCWTFTDPEAYAKCVKGVSTKKVYSIKDLMLQPLVISGLSSYDATIGGKSVSGLNNTGTISISTPSVIQSSGLSLYQQ